MLAKLLMKRKISSACGTKQWAKRRKKSQSNLEKTQTTICLTKAQSTHTGAEQRDTTLPSSVASLIWYQKISNTSEVEALYTGKCLHLKNERLNLSPFFPVLDVIIRSRAKQWINESENQTESRRLSQDDEASEIASSIKQHQVIFVLSYLSFASNFQSDFDIFYQFKF